LTMVSKKLRLENSENGLDMVETIRMKRDHM